jgi:cytochrome c oxidase subunit III
MSATVASGNYVRSKVHPKKFALWIACGSIIMMFVSLTSAYIVRKAGGNWLEFPMPKIFIGSTAVIILSSVALHVSYLAFKRGNEAMYKGFLLTTFVLGIAFLILQYQGWVALSSIGIELNTNPSGSFVYAISGIHAAHILGGITALIIALLHAFSLKYQVTPARKLRFELTLTYWHFVDILWVYLFIFFLIQ